MSLFSDMLKGAGEILDFVPVAGPYLHKGADFLSGVLENQETRDLQQKTYDREDSAVQRRVADLRAAGMSPILASGQGSPTSAPVSLPLAMMKQRADISQTEAETERVRQAAREQKARADVAEASVENEKLYRMFKMHVESNRAALIQTGVDLNDQTIANKVTENALHALSLEIMRATGMEEAQAKVKALEAVASQQSMDTKLYQNAGVPPVLMNAIIGVIQKAIGGLLGGSLGGLMP